MTHPVLFILNLLAAWFLIRLGKNAEDKNNPFTKLPVQVMLFIPPVGLGTASFLILLGMMIPKK